MSARRAALATEHDAIVTEAVTGNVAEKRESPPERQADFAFVPRGVIGDFEDWATVVRGRWSRKEGIGRLEGRGMVLAYRHALRAHTSLGFRIVS